MDKLKITYLIIVIKNLNQIVNMNETGFHSRIHKGRKRKCVYFRNVYLLVTYQQEAPSTTISLMRCVLALGICLPPILSQKNVTFHLKYINEMKNYIICRNSPF